MIFISHETLLTLSEVLMNETLSFITEDKVVSKWIMHLTLIETGFCSVIGSSIKDSAKRSQWENV